MPNTIQPKIKPATYNTPNADDPYIANRVNVQPVVAKSNATTTIIVVIAFAVVAGLAYYYMGQGITNTPTTDPVITQQTQPEPVTPAPAPATPPGETIQDPVPVTPAPAPATPAPAAPVN